MKKPQSKYSSITLPQKNLVSVHPKSNSVHNKISFGYPQVVNKRCANISDLYGQTFGQEGRSLSMWNQEETWYFYMEVYKQIIKLGYKSLD